MIQRMIRDYEVSLWTLQDSFIAVLKQYGLEYKGQIENGKFSARDDGTETFSFSIPMHYYKDGLKILNPSWYNVESGALLINMRKIKLIFNKDNDDRKIYLFLIVKVTELHNDDNSLYCQVECEGLAFHELGKIGYKISLTPDDFYNDDYDWTINGKWYNIKTHEYIETQPLATLNYWNDKVFATINNWDYQICMNWDSHSLWENVKAGVLQDYTTENDIVVERLQRKSDRVYLDDFIDSWNLLDDKLIPKHMTSAREKARVSVNIQDSNIYNITQLLAEIFGVFCRYEYLHDQTCHIIGRHIIYYNNFLSEEQTAIDINYPYQTNSIKREIDSTDLITKLYVKSIEDNSGLLSIIDVGANKSQEDYILNFDYLYNIGGITKLQYEAIDQYILKIRHLNELIAPVSAKVISLQSQLVKVLAELTTKKNAIALDTEQLLANTALLNSITNGDEVLSISLSNPQTAVLILDTTLTRVHSYYVKITQKGVYPETVKLYKKYSYQSSKLLDADEIKTGIIIFDEAGEVIRVNNIFLDNPATDPKTIYITYDYRPKLYYDRIVNMWENRLNLDTISVQKLLLEIAQLNYSLYGTNSKYSLKGVNVANLILFDVYNKYLNLLRLKQEIIKEFNAMMGPAIRLGYWQPEDYSDYGDKYNDRFRIQLNNPNIVPGTTGKSYFAWDDEIFEGEQELYYKYSAAEYLQAYPCIDLSTQNGKKILQLMSLYPDMPISFIYKPTTSLEADSRPRHAPSFAAFKDSITVIPGLYEWENSTGTGIKFNEANFSKLPLIMQGKLNNSNEYNGILNWYMSQGWVENYTTFSWAIDNQTITDISKESNNHSNYRFFNNVLNLSYEYQLQILSTINNPLIDKTFKLTAINMRLQDGSAPFILTKIKGLSENTISLLSNNLQLNLSNDTAGSFVASYLITNESELDKGLNYYIWNISEIKDKNNNQLLNEQAFLEYCDGENVSSGAITLNNNKVLNYDIVINGNIHTITFKNTNNIFSDIALNVPFSVNLIIKNPNDFIQNTNGQTSNQITFMITTRKPIIMDTTNEDKTQVICFSLNDNGLFKLTLQTRVARLQFNFGLQSFWLYEVSLNNWAALSLDNNIFNIQSVAAIIDPDDKTIMRSEVIISIKDGKLLQACSIIQGMNIRAKIGKEDNDTDNDSEYKYFQLNIIIPIYIDNELTAEMLSSLPITLRAELEVDHSISNNENQNYNEYSIPIVALHATTFDWYILPTNSLLPIHLQVNNETRIDVNEDEDEEDENYYRYKASRTTDGTTLTIRIPIFSEDNCSRDNGTQIYCTCSNASGVTQNVPTKINNIVQYQSISIILPILITFENNMKGWWAIPDKRENVRTLSIAMENLLSSLYTLLTNVEIDKILYNNSGEEVDTNINNLNTYFNLLLEQQASQQTNTHAINNYCLYITGNDNINTLQYNNDNIIKTNTTDNDQLYIIQCKITIQWLIGRAPIFDKTYNTKILIRQNVPEFINSEYISTGIYLNNFINKNYYQEVTRDATKVQNLYGTNAISSGSGDPIVNAVGNLVYRNGLPYDVLLHECIVDMADYVDINSISLGRWSCYRKSSPPNYWYTVENNAQLYLILWGRDRLHPERPADIDEWDMQQLRIRYLQSARYSGDSARLSNMAVMRIGILGDLYKLSDSDNITYIVTGYDKRLYLQVRNPWMNNNTYLNTKCLKFVPQAYIGGDN